MLRLFKIANGPIQELDVPAEQQQDNLANADWIDAHEADERERVLLQNLLHIHVPELDEVEEIETSARCFADQAGIHVHALFLAHSEGRHHTVSAACILQKDCLITIHEGYFADFELLRLRAQRGQVEARSPSELLVALLEQKVENHADTLEDINRQLEAVSHMVLEDKEAELDEAISKLARLEDSNGKVHLCLMDTERDISFLLRHLRDQPGQSETLRAVMGDIETLMSHTTFLSDKINFLMDSTRGFMNTAQNQTIKIFSIAAVVFLPPTLVASIYGMNFEHMPEFEWLLGYPWAVGLMILSGVLPYWYFKRKGWF